MTTTCFIIYLFILSNNFGLFVSKSEYLSFVGGQFHRGSGNMHPHGYHFVSNYVRLTLLVVWLCFFFVCFFTLI